MSSCLKPFYNGETVSVNQRLECSSRDWWVTGSISWKHW